MPNGLEPQKIAEIAKNELSSHKLPLEFVNLKFKH